MSKIKTKHTLFYLGSLFYSFSCFGSITDSEEFLNKYSLIYQDIKVKDKIITEGSDICSTRYELIKPILNLQKPQFSVLDLGAAQGYFSFSIAQDFPKSSCVMIESNNTSYYSNHGDMLLDLCFLNDHLNNIFYLEKRVDLADLSYLNERTHFDVIIAFLVVHLMGESLKDQIKIIEKLLSLGDNLILEVANDVNVIHTAYVEFLSEKWDCQYLGEVKRHRDPKSTSTGKLYWFKTKKATDSNTHTKHLPIDKETFQRLNGVFPAEFPFIED